MKKKFFTLYLGLSSVLFSFSQEKILEFSNSLKTSFSDVKDVVPIVNKKNGDVSIFIADAKNIYGYKFDSNFNPIDKLSSEEKRRKYKIIIGNSITENGDYLVFLTNKRNDSFMVTKFSFTNKNSSAKEFKLGSGEEFIQTASVDNNFYLISSKKLTGDLFVYTFNGEGNLKKNKIDLTDLNFINKQGNRVSITELLVKYNTPLKKFEKNTPNSIESVSAKRKMYLRGDDIIFTFDQNKKYTQVLILNLKTLKANNKSFTKPLSYIKSSRRKSNSFIINDNVFVVAGDRDVFEMQILDYKNGNVLKSFIASKDEEIKFKNSPIIQEGGLYNGYRKLKKTKKFLRKITAGKMGISVIEQNNNYIVTVGGYVQQARGGMMPMLGGFGAVALGSIGNVSLFFNPTGFAYNSFSNTKSTRIDCKLDANFDHIKGEINKNAFDKIKDSKKGNRGETVFKYKDYYIFGYYKSLTKKYFLKKYTN